jgi:hypothetical protein
MILERLGLRTLYSRRMHHEALFLINVFNNTIDCQSILDIVSLRVPSKLITDSGDQDCEGLGRGAGSAYPLGLSLPIQVVKVKHKSQQ